VVVVVPAAAELRLQRVTVTATEADLGDHLVQDSNGTVQPALPENQ
jgi:hypothetical protein